MTTILDTRCGTYAGYNHHRRNRSRVCKSCAAANRDYMREYRRRTGFSTSVLVPLDLLKRVEAQVDETLATQIRSLISGTA